MFVTRQVDRAQHVPQRTCSQCVCCPLFCSDIEYIVQSVYQLTEAACTKLRRNTTSACAPLHNNSTAFDYAVQGGNKFTLVCQGVYCPPCHTQHETAALCGGTMR